MFTVAGFPAPTMEGVLMTIAPDRLEDLDFESWPTLDEVMDAPTGTVVDGLVGWERDGVIHVEPAVPIAALVEARERARREVMALAPTVAEVEGFVARFASPGVALYSGYCYCSPSRSMLYRAQAEALNRRARRAARRAKIAAAVSVTALILALVLALV